MEARFSLQYSIRLLALKTIKQYQAFDGTIFSTPLECSRYESSKGWHVCPVCMGQGTVKSDPIYKDIHEENPTGDIFFRGSVTRVLEGYKEVRCSLCKGSGGSIKGFKTITKVVRFEEID